MHCYALVILEGEPEDVDQAVADMLEPWHEYRYASYDDWPADEYDRPFWDWYQIGGRWTGALDPDYSPKRDPRNLDEDGSLLWPTRWARHAGDIARLGDVRHALADRLPYRLVGPGLHAISEHLNPDWTSSSPDDVPTYLPLDDIGSALDALSDDCTVVVVDYHS